jgi:transcriptional regulator with XRE-family HTH domain
MAKREHLGVRLHRLRLERGLTMEVLAKRAGLTRQAISQIERSGGAKASTILPLAKALGVTVGDLLL